MKFHSDLKNKTVYVGVSGGVDSSVTAALLKQAGAKVVGVFIKTWRPDWLGDDICTQTKDRRDAIRVCAHLDIPFVDLDLTEAYKKGVADYMISEYQKGRTPNPDVMCNKQVKFGAFFRWALDNGADFVATGHYAWVEKKDSLFVMKKGVDTGKDQTYFLWTLDQMHLARTIFPLGKFAKSKVRKLAQKFSLPTATKKDSQGICFLGKVSMKDFLRHYINEQPGKVLNEMGVTIGDHNGATFYTLGERHGFTVTEKTPDDRPYYVVAKDVAANTITVSQDPKVYASTHENKIKITDINQMIPWHQNRLHSCQIRYHGKPYQCTVSFLDSADPLDNNAVVTFTQTVPQVSSGQSLVLYNQDVCLGGGVLG